MKTFFVSVFLFGLFIASFNSQADVRTIPVGMRYVSGYASPGEVVQFAFYTQALAGFILTVEADASEMFPAGEKFYENDESVGFGDAIRVEKGWSGVLTSMSSLFSGDPYNPQQIVSIRIPSTTALYGRFDLPLQVRYLIADQTEGGGFFRNKVDEVKLIVPVTIDSATGLKWIKLRDVAGRFSVILVAIVGLLLGVSYASSRTRSSAPALIVGIGCTVVALFWGSHPLAAIFGVVGSGPRLLLFVGEVVVVGFLIHVFFPRPKSGANKLSSGNGNV